MGKNKRKIVNNTTKTKKEVSTKNPPEIKKWGGFLVDVSFEGLYYSVNTKKFNNYLIDEKDFINNFRKVRNLIVKLHGKDFQKDIISSGGFSHCHIIEKNKREVVLESIKESLKQCGSNLWSEDYEKELFGGEKIYQIGFEGSVRLIGTYEESISVFRVYLIDFHHDLHFDERRNDKNPRNLKFCPMKKKLILKCCKTEVENEEKNR